MTEDQYKKLCEACDHILLAADSTIERVAIQWLHVIREHPALLVNYQDLFVHKGRLNLFFNKCLQDLRNWVVRGKALFRSLYLSRKSWSEWQDFPQNADVIFVSHLLNTSQVGESADFYFGDLPKELAQQGYSVVIALIDHSKCSSASPTKCWESDGVYRIILPNALDISQEVYLGKQLKKESKKLGEQAENEADDFLQKVMRRASKEALSSGSLSALRIGMQLGGLAAKLNPAAIVVTHEGHAWERLVFSFTRSKISELTCIGYHHAALFRLQHAIRRNLAREYNPDVILTAGMLGKIQLENSPSLNETSISLLGSNRILKRIEFNSKIPITSDIAEPSVKTACLVLPEGILSECHLLFELSLIYAMQHLNQKFIWRLHPILSFEKLKKHSSIFNKIPDNIYLSGCDLDEDVQKCDSVLYRGSTAVVSAINAGLKPIYYQQNIDELSIDPIYQHLQGKEIVHNQKELNLALNKTINMETKQALQNFAQDFYTPLDVKVLKDAML